MELHELSHAELVHLESPFASPACPVTGRSAFAFRRDPANLAPSVPAFCRAVRFNLRATALVFVFSRTTALLDPIETAEIGFAVSTANAFHEDGTVKGAVHGTGFCAAIVVATQREQGINAPAPDEQIGTYWFAHTTDLQGYRLS
jgi:hypothetical protein